MRSTNIGTIIATIVVLDLLYIEFDLIK